MTELNESLRLTVDEVTARLDPADLPFETTDDLYALDGVFGQERATRSIEFALGMDAPGYNLFSWTAPWMYTCLVLGFLAGIGRCPPRRSVVA